MMAVVECSVPDTQGKLPHSLNLIAGNTNPSLFLVE